jgi:hypothetical protein
MKSRQVAGDNDTITIVATEAITAKRAVAYDGTHTVDLAAMGIALFDTDSGDPISVGVAPIEVVETGAAVTAGAAVETDSSGRVIDYSNGVKIGRAIDGSTDAGEFIRVRMSIQ